MDAPVLLTQDYMPTRRHMRTAHANHVEGQCADAITCIDTVHVMRACVVGSTSTEACVMHMHIYAYTYIYAYTSPGHTRAGGDQSASGGARQSHTAGAAPAVAAAIPQALREERLSNAALVCTRAVLCMTLWGQRLQRAHPGQGSRVGVQAQR
jgi:hypothetical protein